MQARELIAHEGKKEVLLEFAGLSGKFFSRLLPAQAASCCMQRLGWRFSRSVLARWVATLKLPQRWLRERLLQ